MAATNQYGVVSKRPIPGEPGNNSPDTMTYHGFSLEINNVVMGRISNFTPPQLARQINHVRELHPKTFGRPVDIVPSIDENFTLGMQRTEVWNNEFEQATGEADVYAFLTDQTRPFIIRESFLRGSVPYRQWTYLGCWLQERSIEAFDAGGDGMVKLTASIMYVGRLRTI